jgi:AcrR family transcriptional regulator
MALQTIDDHSLAESLFEVFRSRGYEGATLSLLSEVTGLKKSSLYHRFPAGKDDMVKAVALYVSSQLHEHVIQPLLNSNEIPEIRFENMLTTIKAFYDDGKKNCLLNVLGLGETKAEINELLNNDYNAWLAALIKLGRETGLNQNAAKKRSEHFLIVVEGTLVIQRLTNNRLAFQNSMEYEKKQFFKQSTS